MKNTIITSISALIFLVIGLLIGKSNKQIEIQTIVKTNIVEVNSIKPKTYTVFRKRFNDDEIPLASNTVSIEIYIDELLKGYVDEDVVKNKIELEARRIGLKVIESKYREDNEIYFSVNVLEQKPLNGFIFSTNFRFRRFVDIDSNSDKYFALVPIFEKGEYGFQPKNNINTAVNNYLIQHMDEFCNAVLKLREK